MHNDVVLNSCGLGLSYYIGTASPITLPTTNPASVCVGSKQSSQLARSVNTEGGKVWWKKGMEDEGYKIALLTCLKNRLFTRSTTRT